MTDENKKEKVNEEKKDSGKGNSTESTFSKVTTILNIVILVISLGISWIAIDTSRELARYQIEQERLPNVVCLNQEVVLQFEVDSFDDVIKDYSAIKNANLRIYNLGVGTAQNCEMSWDIESIKRACLSTKELLTDSSIVQEVEGVEALNFMIYEYGFEMENSALKSIWYYDKKEGLMESVLEEEIVKIPYILPITDEESEIYIPVPEPVILMLLEIGHQGVKEKITLELNISYQDSASTPYNEKYEVEFKLKETTEENVICCKYDVSISKRD